MKRWLTWAAGFAGLLGMLLTGVITADTRYAKAGDVRRQVDEIKVLQLKSEARSLSRDRFALEVERARRPLTRTERERLTQIEEELRDVEAEIRALHG